MMMMTGSANRFATKATVWLMVVWFALPSSIIRSCHCSCSEAGSSCVAAHDGCCGQNQITPCDAEVKPNSHCAMSSLLGLSICGCSNDCSCQCTCESRYDQRSLPIRAKGKANLAIELMASSFVGTETASLQLFAHVVRNDSAARTSRQRCAELSRFLL